MSQSDLLFVYGTLRHDLSHEMHGILARNAILVGTGWSDGTLFDIQDYPGMVRHPATTRVRGEVYRLDSAGAASTLAKLDKYEGCAANDPQPHEYRRERVGVELDDGGRVEAWAYIYQRPTTGLLRIESGDYAAYVRRVPSAVRERPSR